MAELERLESLDHTPHFVLAALLAGDDVAAAVVAINGCARSGAPVWDLGYRQLYLAHRLRRAGEKASARERLVAALDHFTSIGATDEGPGPPQRLDPTGSDASPIRSATGDEPREDRRGWLPGH